MGSAALAATAFGTAAAQTSEAGADAAAADRGPVIDEIVVTAQRREQGLQEVPLSLSAITGEQLSDRQLTDVTDIAKVDPSVTYTQSTNPLNSSIRIRGIGTDVFSSAVEPSVSIVVDGVVMARQGQAFADLIDIERVEVLRGPQSTLFGKNASAGVLSITTADPTDTFTALGEVIVAELDEVQVRGTVSGPLSDTVGGRLTAYFKDVGGHVDNAYDGRNLNGNEAWGVRGKLLFEPSDTLSVNVIADYRDAEAECCAWQYRRVDSPALLAALGPVTPSDDNQQTFVGGEVLNESQSWGLSAEVEAGLGAYDLVSLTAYRGWDFQNTIDIDGTPSLGGLPVFLGGILGFDTNDGFTDIAQFSQEFRLASPGDGPVTWLAGAYASRLDLDRRFERRICLANFSDETCPALLSDINPALPGIPAAQSGFFDGTVDNTNLGLFGQIDWQATDRLTLTAGGRFIYDETEFSFARPNEPLRPGDSVNGANIPEADRFGEGQVDDTAFTSRLAAAYAASDDVNLYASYVRGFKGPTVDVGYEADDEPVGSETSDAYEIGLKSVLAEGRVVLNLALFDVTYDDYQAQTYNAAATEFRLENAGKVSTQGLEVDLTARPTDALRLGFSASFIDAKIDEFPNGQCYNPVSADPDCRADGTKDLSGGDLNNAPDIRLVTNARYDLVLPDTPFDLFLQADYRWQDEVQFSVTQNPETVQDSYGVFDLAIGGQDTEERITATVFVKNLFDQDYVDFILADPVNTGSVNIARYRPKAANRYVGAQLRVRY